MRILSRNHLGTAEPHSGGEMNMALFGKLAEDHRIKDICRVKLVLNESRFKSI